MIITNVPDWAKGPFVEVEYGPSGIGPTHPMFTKVYLEPALAVLSNMTGRALTGENVNIFVSMNGVAIIQERLDSILEHV